MRLIRRSLFAALPCFALAACVPSPPEPTPAPPPAPVPTPLAVQRPAPFPVQSPAFTNWMDAPITPGEWTYAAGTAQFADSSNQTLFSLGCDRAAGAVTLSRWGTSAPVPLHIKAETQERMLDAQPAESDPPKLTARISARDPLLDAMAFSKGRFAVEVSGAPTLYVPAYPEVTRVIEDCR